MYENVLAWLVGACISILLICCTVFGLQIYELKVDLQYLAQDISYLKEKDEYYDSVMRTYEFFNTQWTKQMMGEK